MIAATQAATKLRDVIRSGRPVDNHSPWPRAIVNRETWRQASRLLSGGQWTLLGLWAEREQVHMAVDDNGQLGVLSVVCEDNLFPSIGQFHPPAIRLERAIRDLWRPGPEGLAGARAELQHRPWPIPPPVTRGRQQQ